MTPGSMAGTRGRFFEPAMNSCTIASSGFSRLSGSHRRQREMKSKKASSSHLIACWRGLELGRRRLPSLIR